MKIKNLVFKSFDNLSIRTKLMTTFFILIILPLSFFTYITYNRTSNQLKEQTLSTQTLVFNESVSGLSNYFSNMITVTDLILYDKEIYNIVERNLQNYDAEARLKDYNTIINKFNYLQKTTNVDKINLYLNTNIPTEENTDTIFNVNSVLNTNWYTLLKDSKENRHWCPPSICSGTDGKADRFFSYFAIFYNSNNFRETDGFIKIDIHTEKILNLMKGTTLTKNSSIYITDLNTLVFSAERSLPIANPPLPWSLYKNLKVNQWNYAKYGNESSFIKYNKISNTPWYLVSVIPEKDVYALSIKIRTEMIILMLIISTIAYFLAYFISRSSLKRIYRLTKEVQKVENGNLKITSIKSGNDEIGLLIKSFIKMVNTVSQLLEDKYLMGLNIKNAELKALQAQINPHFLYNSLDLINCIAIKNKIPQITQMVNSLAKFYKISLSKGADIITVIDELTHAYLYVQIQNMRFNNKVALEVDIDESLYKYSTMKIILQPIIENSILHGILEKHESTGKIIIRCRLENETLIFSVEDDGVGMPPEKVLHILSSSDSDETTGYGVKNTNDRIKLFYGNEYGLKYSSTIGYGTCVEIRIPALPNS
jgi:two-component system sensor histidine kinase YesM